MRRPSASLEPRESPGSSFSDVSPTDCAELYISPSSAVRFSSPAIARISYRESSCDRRLSHFSNALTVLGENAEVTSTSSGGSPPSNIGLEGDS